MCHCILFGLIGLTTVLPIKMFCKQNIWLVVIVAAAAGIVLK